VHFFLVDALWPEVNKWIAPIRDISKSHPSVQTKTIKFSVGLYPEWDEYQGLHLPMNRASIQRMYEEILPECKQRYNETVNKLGSL
jgi:hypothetical protein